MDNESANAAAAFGLDITGSQSLCPYGPVFRIATADGEIVLKRTGFPRSSGKAIAAWLHGLSSRGVAMLVPDGRYMPNPRRIEGQWPGEWVVYPFVTGKPYHATVKQIETAGTLLGQVHAAGSDLGDGMMEEPHLPLRSSEWITEHAARSERVVAEHASSLSATWGSLLADRLARHAKAEPRLRKMALPVAACSWDYKASNLVFVSANPVLIDPDHAGRIPRLYDLACALLLFHCDHASSPGRLFTQGEWTAFAGGYAGAVTLEVGERHAWSDVLLAAWIDQALWLIANWPEGWSDERERTFLTDLATVDLDAFELWSDADEGSEAR